MQVSAVLMRALLGYLRDAALPAEAVMRAAELDSEELSTRDQIDLRSFSRAVRVARELGAGPDLALLLGRTTPALSFGLVGQLFAHCTTLREALCEARQFVSLLCPGASLTLLERGKRASVQCAFPPLSVDGRRFAADLSLAALVTLLRQFAGESAAPQVVRLPYPAPPQVAPYESTFRCRVAFGSEAAELIVDSEVLDVKQPFADARLRDLLKHQAECLLTAQSRAVPLHLRVRALLERDEALAGESSFGQLARKLGVSRRSLRRKLAAEGRTFSGLLDDFRKEQALTLLVDLNLPVKQVSERLGFSEPSAFHRAFKRWTGFTPIQLRSRQMRNMDAA